MITFRLTGSGILVVQPSGPLSEEDFSALQQKVDPWLAAGNKLKGLLIDAPDFPGWKDFASLRSHLHFVKDHHRELPRIAVVSDSRFLSAMPKLARHFVSAEFKRFEAGKTDDAIDWLESPIDPKPPSIRHAWFPAEKLVWIALNGKVTTEDYRVFLGSMEDILTKHSPISFIVNFDGMDGVELGAMAADTKFGFAHLKDIKRIALVGDSKWTKRLTSLPNPFSLEIKSFDEDEENDAWDWITGTAGL
jgi:hypothetical protein